MCISYMGIKTFILAVSVPYIVSLQKKKSAVQQIFFAINCATTGAVISIRTSQYGVPTFFVNRVGKRQNQEHQRAKRMTIEVKTNKYKRSRNVQVEWHLYLAWLRKMSSARLHPLSPTVFRTWTMTHQGVCGGMFLWLWCGRKGLSAVDAGSREENAFVITRLKVAHRVESASQNKASSGIYLPMNIVRCWCKHLCLHHWIRCVWPWGIFSLFRTIRRLSTGKCVFLRLKKSAVARYMTPPKEWGR